ncbi:MAG: toll/interleukin-1 receptor domain-containing protein [Verrucomicrobiales bacterium]|nr:toll/interleukin-1 receptor domain-containing protein [Verrucomicrobiales bacterium]
MSSLSFTEKRTLENFLQMSGGYVLNFSNRTFGEFVEEITGLNVEDEVFNGKGTSKANRLRSLWESQPNPVIGKLLNALIDYAILPEHSPEPERLALVSQCQGIANRLLGEVEPAIEPLAAEVFVSYRRDDAAAEAKLIHECLKAKLGGPKVFMDVSSIQPGQKWPDEISRNLNTASTAVVVIGPKWLMAGSNEWGLRRIDEESDWVRQEIETALQSGKRIIPVIVDGAKVPPEHALPVSIRELFKRQCIEIRRNYWDHDIRMLENALSAPMSVSPAAHSSPVQQPPSPVSVASSEEIKRQRDLKQLTELFRWISLGAMDRFLHWLSYNGWITNEGHFLWERLGWLIESSRFDLRDAELKARLIAFMNAWGKCFTHFIDMEQHRNGKVFFFDVHDGDEGRYIREQNNRAKFNGEQARPLKAAFDHFLDHIREHYLEIDLEMAGQEGLAEYKEEEAQLMNLIRLTEQADRIP